MMIQPEVGNSELEHGEEVGDALFVSRGEPSEVVDPVEEPFNTTFAHDSISSERHPANIKTRGRLDALREIDRGGQRIDMVANQLRVRRDRL
jgi:hypothetical protein